MGMGFLFGVMRTFWNIVNGLSVADGKSSMMCILLQ